MIEAICGCGWTWARPESAGDANRVCPKCGSRLALACAEALPDGAGAGDFDAIFDVIDGPDREGDRIFLGGVADIVVGKHDAAHVRLAGGQMVSRQHCRLVRQDFGPSRWGVVDNRSTNGLFVNDRRVESHDLADGEVVKVGEYELRYGHVAQPAPAAAPAVPQVHLVPSSSDETCPSCEQHLPHKAKICVACGIKLPTGRPVLLSADTDESVVHGNAETYISLLSWIVWVTPLPIPLFSEAFGAKKPWAIRIIAALTCVGSLLFLLGSFGSDRGREPGRSLMLWPPGAHATAPDGNLDDLIRRELESDGGAGEVSDADLRRLQRLFVQISGEPFHAYQLLSYAFLHDNSSILGFAMHLGGNLLFMLVFGTRVNALLGNVATAIIYPVLAVGAALVHLWLGDPVGPMLGASGAIQGLAGMYLILFPVHRVYCGMWFRFRLWVTMKIFAVRGFWVLLIYFAYDALMVALNVSSGTAHWAHIGGFLCGVAIALGLLVSRRVYCGGGDLLSVALGRYAWGLIGKPGRWNRPAVE